MGAKQGDHTVHATRITRQLYPTELPKILQRMASGIGAMGDWNAISIQQFSAKTAFYLQQKYLEMQH
ncbi:MAG: hypothetical protein AAF694_13955 [Bacteroidota bacterium]